MFDSGQTERSHTSIKMWRCVWKFVPFVVAASALVCLQVLGWFDQASLAVKLTLAVLPNCCLMLPLASVTGKTLPEYECGHHIMVSLVFSVVADTVLAGWSSDYFAMGFLILVVARGRHAAALQYQSLNLWLGAVLYAVSSWHMYTALPHFDWTMSSFSPVAFLTIYTSLGRGLARPNYVGTPRRATEFAAAAAQLLLILCDHLMLRNQYQSTTVPRWLITAFYLTAQLGMTLYGMQSKERYDEFVVWWHSTEARLADSQQEPAGESGSINKAYSYQDQVAAISRKISDKFGDNLRIISLTVTELDDQPTARLSIKNCDMQSVQPAMEQLIRTMFAEEGIHAVNIDHVNDNQVEE